MSFVDPRAGRSANMIMAVLVYVIYNNLLRPDDMSVLRSITAVSFTYRASDALAIRSDFTSTGRNGEMPWAASFAFNNANVLPAPIDHRNNELKLNTEWVNQKGMFRLD